MNRRIARKILKKGYSGGPIPDDPEWNRQYDRGRRARRYNDKVESSFKKTMRLVQRARANPQRLVDEWPALRAYLWHRMRRREGQIRGESIEEGRLVGLDEIERWRARRVDWRNTPTDGDVVSAIVGTLHYFSDRWCVSRVGRMDVMVEALAAELRGAA